MNLKYPVEYQIFKNEGASYLFVFIIFLLSPIVAFVAALIKYKSKYSHFVFVLFTSVFGYNMVAESEAFDLYRVHELLQVYNPYTISQIVSSYIYTWTNKGENFVDMHNSADLYSSVVSIIVSRFTSNGKVLMAVFGLIYGYVFVSVLKKFLNNLQHENSFTVLILLFASFMMPLHQLAGVRYGTATYIFVFGILSYFQSNENDSRIIKLILLTILSCLVHFSFVLPAFILFFYVFILSHFNTEKLLYALYSIYLLSFLFPNLLSSVLPSDIGTMFGEGIASRTSAYTDSVLNNENKSYFYTNASWYVVFPGMLLNLSIKLGVFIWFFYRKKVYHKSYLLKILSLTILLLIIVNISADISNLGLRLMRVIGLLFFYYLFVLQQQNFSNQLLKNILTIISLLMGLKIMLDLRFIIEYTSLVLYYGSVFHIVNDTTNTSLWTMIQIWYQKIAY